MRSRTLNAFKVFGMFSVNSSIVYYGWREQQKHNDYYHQLPEDEQRKIYNQCVLQKVGGSTVDGISAVQERMWQTDRPAHEHLPPLKPYSPSRHK